MAKNEEIKFSDGVKKMTSDEIGLELKTLRDKLYTLRSQSVTEKVEDVSQFGITKRNIARLLTEQSFRRIHGDNKPHTHAAHTAKPAKRAVKPAVKKVAKKAGKVAAAHSHARPVRKKATKGVKAAPSRKATKAKTKATAKAKAAR
jgi:ribosomal protein L29